MNRIRRINKFRRIQKFRNNLRQYLLYVFLQGKPEPIYVGYSYTIRGLLELLAEWERVEGFEGAYLEIKY